MVEFHYVCDLCGAEASGNRKALEEKGWLQVYISYAFLTHPEEDQLDPHAYSDNPAVCPKCIGKLNKMFTDWR